MIRALAIAYVVLILAGLSMCVAALFQPPVNGGVWLAASLLTAAGTACACAIHIIQRDTPTQQEGHHE